MKFLIDAQLPPVMAKWFRLQGLDVVHSIEFPAGNTTTDSEIMKWIAVTPRVVISKDSDFVDMHMLKSQPQKLLFINVGNIGNRRLRAIVEPLISRIEAEFLTHDFLEIDHSGLIIRDTQD